MKLRVLALMAAAILVVGLPAVPGLATFTDTDSGDTNSSEAEISVVDCVVESTKDISYIAFLDSGAELDKFNINAPTYDLTSYGHIDSVDSVRVKSGETVESFGVDCGDTAKTDDDTTGDHDDDTTGDHDDDTTGDHDDDTTGDEDDDVAQPDEVKSHNDKAGTNSQATITLSGCTLNSSKDISYIAFLSDGSEVDKIEGVDAEIYNLDNYGGIDDIDKVRVKAGTTVATFSVSCGDGTHDEAKDDDTHTDDHATDDHHDHDSKDDDAKEEDSDDDLKDEDDSDKTDGEWDARHDGRHDHKDHEEIEKKDS